MTLQDAAISGKFFKRAAGPECLVTTEGQIWDACADKVAELTSADLLATDWQLIDDRNGAYEAFGGRVPQ